MKSFKSFSTLTEATKLWLGFDDLPTKMHPNLKQFFIDLKSVADAESVYVDDKYDFLKASKRLTIKITDKRAIPKMAVDRKLVTYGFSPLGNKYLSSNLVNVSLTPSGGVRGSGKLARKGDKVTIPTTSEQEQGTIEYFKAAFSDSDKDIKTISDKVGYNFSPVWMHNFEQQYLAFTGSMGTDFSKHKIYLDSDSKSDSSVLLRIAKKLGLKDKKDNWNPSDIWIMSIGKAQIISQTKNMSTLEEFNAWLVKKYHSKEIIGVSLKKVSPNKKGIFQTVSNSSLPDVDVKVSRVLFDPFQKNFILETDGNIKGFNIRVGYKASTVSRDSDIRIYLEGRQKGSQVQLGAVSALLFPALAKKNGFDIKTSKKTILDNPMKYLNKTLPILLKNPVVVDKVSKYPDTEIGLKAGAFLAFYLEIFLGSDPSILKSCYYSSTKVSDFSSIHCKVY